jgi:hypothetical protein
MFFNISITTFFFVTGWQVVESTKKPSSSKETLLFYKKLRKLTFRLMASGVFMILWLIPLIIAAFVPSVFFNPVGNAVTWFFIMLILLITSYMEIKAITLPPKKIIKSSKSEKSKAERQS